MLAEHKVIIVDCNKAEEAMREARKNGYSLSQFQAIAFDDSVEYHIIMER